MKKIFFPGLIAVIMFSAHAQTSLTSYVNPFIGTDNMGHTYPGATVPFGMVQLSPETDSIPYSDGTGYVKEVYRYCSGYQYDDNTIVGFSHTHFSGTGHSDLGDFRIMPTVGKLQLNPGTEQNPDTGYRSRFLHSTEKAIPGYYSVNLEDYNIKAEFTTSARVGFHKYKFPKTDEANIILDMTSGIYDYDGKVIWSSIRVENDTLVTGYRQTRGWARTKLLYFAMSFSKPIKNYGYTNKEEQIIYNGFYRKFNEGENFPEMAGKKVVAYFRFETKEKEDIQIKFALSPVSTAGALNNLNAEIPHWDFERVRSEALAKWEDELSAIRIEGTEDRKEVFYTALYHTFLNPTIYMDVDGSYRGLDQNIHKAEGFDNYTTFSLWDTYRALHPLFTIVQQKRTNDMISSMLAHQQQSVHKVLPVWSHHANENWCMIGYHAVPVIVDAYMKGIRDYDLTRALDACISSATYGLYDGLEHYMKYGYLPADLNSNSASKTLEYSYDDWTISIMASNLGKEDVAETFRQRAKSFESIFDDGINFMRPKDSKGNWITPFDPLSTHGQGFIEGNAWNYSLYVPHDVSKLIGFYGGNESFSDHLDTLFTMSISDEDIAQSEDITKAGIIGNYVHGNEPSHHVPYLYNYAQTPWKTQERIHQIVNVLYRNTNDGLCGNDDCGQMSAWYIFSVMGFYPVAPGSNEYIFGSPCVSEATINLENGNQFRITTEKLSEENIYIHKVLLNGEEYKKPFLLHEDIMSGGSLKFIMDKIPNKNVFDYNQFQPYSLSNN